jgi:tetratricopeptide (TPR) repeat protein
MSDNPRIADLRRRIQKDPASIAFAQLAEELRRAGEFREAADICRAGLTVHPAYLSARVTLGRALLALDQLRDAQEEFEHVLLRAPENLAAVRGLADIHRSQGAAIDALKYYRTALALAPHDFELRHTVDTIRAQIDAANDLAAGAVRAKALATVAALQQYLDAIHVARAQRLA